MAKKRSRARSTKASTSIVRVAPMRAPAPIIRVSAPRAPAHHKKKHRRRHHAGGLGLGGGSWNKLIASVAAGWALGMLDKSGTSLPTVPFLGRAGTIAVAAQFFGKGQGIWGEISRTAAGIAGYEMGSTGKIAGEVNPQVSGIAAQV